MDAPTIFLVVLTAVIAVAVAIHQTLRRVTVFEYERALDYRRGRFDRILEPGQYWYCPLWTRIQSLDVRPSFVTIPGQELLTSDGVTLKASLAARYRVVDPDAARNRVQDYQGALYLELQIALREIIGAAPIDELLDRRPEFAKRLLELASPKASGLGLELEEVNLKDIMFPGALKQTFAQVVEARKEGQAALERARGETAALRKLANAASMLGKNPALLQLRLLQSVSTSSGNTLVFGMPPPTLPVPVRADETPPSPGGAEKT